MSIITYKIPIAALQNHTQTFHEALDGPNLKQAEDTDENVVTELYDDSRMNFGSSSTDMPQKVNASFDTDEPIAILVIACNRETVSRSIDSLLR